MRTINLMLLYFLLVILKIEAQTNSNLLEIENIIFENTNITQGERIKVDLTIKNKSSISYSGDLILSLHNNQGNSVGDIGRNSISILPNSTLSNLSFYYPANQVKWDEGEYHLIVKHTYLDQIHDINNLKNSISIKVKKPTNHYKLGVVLFDRPNLDIRKQIDEIVFQITDNEPHRELGNKKLDLVIQLEVSWNDTNTEEGMFNFERFIEIAKICKQKGIKWTPLLSVHYVPEWALIKYEKHRLRDTKGNIIPLNNTRYLRFSPSSSVWSSDIKIWINKFIESLNNYIGENNTIEEILIGNEMMYPDFNIDQNNNYLYSKDNATLNAWKSRNYGLDISYFNRIEKIIPENYNETTLLQNFKAEELSYAIASMTNTAIKKLNELGKIKVGVSSKLFPYFFPNNSWSAFNMMKGYTNSSLSHLDNNFRAMFAIDSYPNNYCGNGKSSLLEDYEITINHPDRNYKRTLKNIYVAEFNRPYLEECKNYILNSNDVYSAIIDGINNYNVRYFTFFAWNSDSSSYKYNMTPTQKDGMKKAFNSILPKKEKINSNSLIKLTSLKEEKLYPNPSQKELFFKNKSAKFYEILSIDGTTIKNAVFKKKVDISDLNKGVYIIKFLDINKKVLLSRKVLKN